MESIQGQNLYDYKQIIESGLPFTDTEFPADLTSLFDPAQYSEETNIDLFTTIEWKRASEIYPNGYKVFPSELSADCICQGKLGDCYFITCLAALASKPERILKLIKTESVNEAGCYVVNLCVNGTWQDIVVDDYFPVNPSTG